MKLKITQTKLVFILSFFWVCFYNFTFFSKTLNVYPLSLSYLYFLFSLICVLFFAINLIINILRVKFLLKPFLILILFLSMLAAYVMDSYGVVIDETMILNILKTDTHESLDLYTWKLLLYFIFLFLVPAGLIYKLEIDFKKNKTEIKNRLLSILASVVVIFLMILSNGKTYASFFREHKSLRYYTNPSYFIYSTGKFASTLIASSEMAFAQIGEKSIIPPNDNDRELIILIVGETARRDRFSLNGYKRETNPLLKKEDRVVSFTNVTSCGTSTAISVPCLFSNFGRDKFDVSKAHSTENLLDVLVHTKDVNVLWRDNNSDSKGVALRVPYMDYKTSKRNTICNPECRDEGMLVGLQEHIDQVKEKDIVIVLHQMGNHGPAYYKRYPDEFEVFKPVCKTSELSACSNEEINNAYDNAILYTDYFLSKIIALLKVNSLKFNTAMLYISDHGESLGENGIYLHSMPYLIAPKEQVEVPLIMWLGGNLRLQTDFQLLDQVRKKAFSHDNIFHTILGLMEIESETYKADLDILHGIQSH